MENAPQILAMDTALGRCSVALLQGGSIVAEEREETIGQQSRMLVTMIETVLKRANVQYKNLDAIACTIGPGGFTGIRVGLATARAIALATGKPLIGLTTLEVIASASGVTGDVVARIDAHRSQWYVQRFRINGTLEAVSAPLLADEKEAKALAHGAKIAENPLYAAEVAALAHAKWMRGERAFADAPLYIREADAKLSAGKGLKYSGELL